MNENRVPLRVRRRVWQLAETRARDGELTRINVVKRRVLSAGASCPGPIEGKPE